MHDWFTTEKINEKTFVISEYRHPEETHSYLLFGDDRALLIDTGLGVGNMAEEVKKLSSLPVTAIATHVHWDHIGGHTLFPDFYVHEAEKAWIEGKFPLPTSLVKRFLAEGDLPQDFDLDSYEIFRGIPTMILRGGEMLDLGGRFVQALHTPGHAPGHLCFWEAQTGYLFTGDLVYKGTLYANYESTDPTAFLSSLEKIADLPVKRLFPAHHSLDVSPTLLTRTRDAFREIQKAGKLRHGGGSWCFDDFSILL